MSLDTDFVPLAPLSSDTKLFFWELEVSVIHSYVLYKDWSVRNGKAISHNKYRQTLLMSLIGDFRAPETSHRTEVAADTEQRLDRITHTT